MRARILWSAAALAVSVVLSVFVGACGGDGGGADGKAVFSSAGCGTCHTLRDAGTTATVGPNLDERKPTKEKAEAIVRVGIRGTMPAFENQLSDDEIEAVAEYVSTATGGGSE